MYAKCTIRVDLISLAQKQHQIDVVNILSSCYLIFVLLVNNECKEGVAVTG
jgi:hypothetical protein